ncbi:MAG: single-stranded DNA-binding protein [Candidatus Caldatribacteriota bacterium]|jgi:single-strand DNA-binding protein|nr:single-stranded DNA-binding protein [Atribacterota bacterium]MDD3031250.1 single-stranded DNA-binding protein [Atribacterota bacterium]MDD3640564.1 single-stranded DNA-binding protein [Atribacterota bacterium]MDD4288660.1 single-stranded DNA-binding protein [Atribacterota bacterium]MDD4764480.1 single-stranded DNA-binding protein [Atribacterota bacterium]
MASFGDLNCFAGIGRLTRDPELRYTPAGTAVCKFGLAINRSFRNQEGNNIEDTLFINVSAWGRQAEHCSQFLKKGKRVAVNGELRSNNWQDKEGNKRVSYEINARSVQFLDYMKDSNNDNKDFSDNDYVDENSGQGKENVEDNNGEDDIPF